MLKIQFRKTASSALHLPNLKDVVNPRKTIPSAEKSTQWTHTGVDQNFQRDFGAIGLYEFQGTSVWTNPLVPCFQARFGALFSGKICMD